MSIWNKNQRWIDKKVKRMRPSEATMFKTTFSAAINLVSEIDKIPKETMDDSDRIFDQINPTSLFSSYIDQLRLAISEPNRFIKGLHFFFSDMATEISKNRLQEQFFQALYTYVEKCSQEDNMLLRVLSKIIFYQLYYLNPNQDKTDRTVCGITSYGEIMTVKNPYPGFDSTVQELNQSSDSAVVNICRSHGIPVSSKEEYDILYQMLLLYKQQVQNLSVFIDEYTYDILPDFKTLKHVKIDTPLFDITFHDYFRENHSEIVNRIRSKRRKTLPLNGIMIYFRSDDKDFPVQRILMKEVFHSDSLTLLYKAETLIGDLPGCYDISSNALYDLLTPYWEKCDGYHVITDMITYLYACIVLDRGNGLFENKNRYMRFVKERDDNDKPLTLFPYEIIIQSLGDEKENTYKRDERISSSQMREDTVIPYMTRKTRIPGYIRPLPKGQKRSQNASDLAERLGIELQPNETYVRTHQKKVRYLKHDTPWNEQKMRYQVI